MVGDGAKSGGEGLPPEKHRNFFGGGAKSTHETGLGYSIARWRLAEQYTGGDLASRSSSDPVGAPGHREFGVQRIDDSLGMGATDRLAGEPLERFRGGGR